MAQLVPPVAAHWAGMRQVAIQLVLEKQDLEQTSEDAVVLRKPGRAARAEAQPFVGAPHTGVQFATKMDCTLALNVASPAAVVETMAAVAAQVALQAWASHLLRAQPQTAHLVADPESLVLETVPELREPSALELLASKKVRAAMSQSPEVWNQMDRRQRMEVLAAGAQIALQYSEAPLVVPEVAPEAQVYPSGPLLGRRDADCQSGSPAKVLFGLSGRRSTLNIPLFQMIANHH